MGYTTEFDGSLDITPALSNKQVEFINTLTNTRRMGRNVEAKYGVEGEFYFGQGDSGQDREPNIINYNTPPKTQPGLWCQWKVIPTQLMWDGGEKFYDYISWLSYLINSLFENWNKKLNDGILWQGEEEDDFGTIYAKNNVLTIIRGLRLSDFDNKLEYEIISSIFKQKKIDTISIKKIIPHKRKLTGTVVADLK